MEVVLTKYNSAKRNLQGDLTCCFCHKNETTNHLFFECPLACFIRIVLHITTGKEQPNCVKHMFSGWLHGLDGELKPLFMLGAAAIYWSL